MKKLLCMLIISALCSCSATRRTAQSPAPPPKPATGQPVQTGPAAKAPAAKRTKRAAQKPIPAAERPEQTGPTSGQPSQPTVVAVQPLPGPFLYSQSQNITYPNMPAIPKEGLTITPASWSHFCYPVQGNKISDYGIRSGRMHSGVDIKAQPLDTIRAVADGVVRMSKEYYGYGNMVVISHHNGLETLYGHNTRNLVAPNQKVRGGEAIALAGRTGRATTEHCHFEVRAAGQYFDPNLMLDCAARSLRPDTLRISMPGTKLMVSSSGEGGGGTTGSSTGATTTDSYHIVRQGDTLYSISHRYGVGVNRLCELNRIAQTATLHIGQKILLK